MTACVILHNMIIADERDLDLEYNHDNAGSRVKPVRDADEITAFLEPAGRSRTVIHTTNSSMILLSIVGNSTGKIDSRFY